MCEKICFFTPPGEGVRVSPPDRDLIKYGEQTTVPDDPTTWELKSEWMHRQMQRLEQHRDVMGGNSVSQVRDC